LGKEKKGFFKRLRSGLSKSREQLNEKLETAFIGRKEIDEETLDDLDPNDVFVRCLDVFEVPDEDRDELVNAYQEIITMLQEEDANAE